MKIKTDNALFSLTELVTELTPFIYIVVCYNNVFDLDIEILIKMDNQDITSSVNVNWIGLISSVWRFAKVSPEYDVKHFLVPKLHSFSSRQNNGGFEFLFLLCVVICHASRYKTAFINRTP